MKKTYFLSDAHLGSRALEHKRTHERRLVSFLDKIKDDAAAIFFLGDIFDFWYEYKEVVPKGFTRFLGKVSELTDKGVEVHFFTGNHDLWCGDYFEKECGMIIHRKPLMTEINDKIFYLAHGDEFSEEKSYKILRRIFHSKVLQTLFSTIHPRWSIDMGLSWAYYSMRKHKMLNDTKFMGEDKENCMVFAKKYIKKFHSIDCFIFGHRHIDAECKIGENSACIIMGDWISSFSYVEYDGINVSLKHYCEGADSLN